MQRLPATALRDALRLYLVTDQDLCRGRHVSSVVQDAVHGGVGCVQLREKRGDTRDFLQLARALKVLLSPLHIPLVINDRIDIALVCHADGVHLGQSDMPVDDARRLLPAHVFIGWSVENLAQVQQAHALPVDYLGVSPVFATPTKTDTQAPWGLGGLQSVRQATQLPLVAIGGIHVDNAAQVLRAGADGLAVVSAICAANAPREAAHALRTVIDTHFTPT